MKKDNSIQDYVKFCNEHNLKEPHRTMALNAFKKKRANDSKKEKEKPTIKP